MGNRRYELEDGVSELGAGRWEIGDRRLDGER